ncbi:MAG: histidine phosphatase family protein [Phycisphaerae bacterium]
MNVVLIPCASSDWREAGRIMGRVELDPAKQGEEHCKGWVEKLRAASIDRIDTSPDDLCKRTAKLLAEKTGAAVKSIPKLDEVDVGLWAGLTLDQLKQRYETAYRELCESPLHVTPPEGESFAHALERLSTCMKKRIRKNGITTLGFVLRPLAFALAQYALLPEFEESDIWSAARAVCEPVYIDASPAPASANS